MVVIDVFTRCCFGSFGGPRNDSGRNYDGKDRMIWVVSIWESSEEREEVEEDKRGM